MAIPRIIWQGWCGPNPAPEAVVGYCAEMKQMNPDFEYHFFGNEMLQKYGNDPYVKHMIATSAKWAFVMDRLRVLILRDHGGMWIDPDAKPVRPLNSIRVWDDDRWDFVTAHRSAYRPDVQIKRGVACVDNTFMGSAKNGRMIQRLVGLSDSRAPIRKGAEYGWEMMDWSGLDTAWLSPYEFYSLGPDHRAIVLHDDRNLATWTDHKPMKFANAL
jgi:hypothetical protein